MNKKLVIELFAGTRSVGKAFEDRGYRVVSYDWDEQFEDCIHRDIGTLSAQEVLDDYGKPYVIWASFDCTTYSIAAISHHRTKNHLTGNLDPKSEYAKECDRINRHVISLVKELKPKYFFFENPRGGMRKMDFMSEFPRYTVTYCQYGDTRMKPTDIWTNHPNPRFKPMCKNGDPCHEKAPRGSKTGTQGLKGSKARSVIPRLLCEHIAEICED